MYEVSNTKSVNEGLTGLHTKDCHLKLGSELKYDKSLLILFPSYNISLCLILYYLGYYRFG